MTAEELFLSNLDEIERAARFVAGRSRLSQEDAEDLDSAVKLRLMENNYKVLVSWKKRCVLSTYVASIAHRLVVDEWMKIHGRWRPSAEAKRLGKAAILIEGLLVRDHMPFDDALRSVQRIYPLSKHQVTAIAARLPHRGPRPRLVALEEEAEPSVSADSVEERVIDHERAAKSQDVNCIVQALFSSRPDADRVAFHLRYGENMSIADIARLLEVDQKQLYRRFDSMHAQIKKAIEAGGITAEEVLDLIGSSDSHLDFDLRRAEKQSPRQPIDQRGSGNHEVPE